MSHWSPYQPFEDGLPPNEMRITELRGEPWPDHSQRVRIHLEITPFLERPNLLVIITSSDGEEISSAHIIETIETRMTFTLHLRGEVVYGPYHLKAKILYSEVGMVDEKSVAFDIHEPGSQVE